jgi:hypothetical protein
MRDVYRRPALVDPAEAIADVLDEAHQVLPTPELAHVLVRVEHAASPLGRNAPPAAEELAQDGDPRGLSTPARGYLRRLHGLVVQLGRAERVTAGSRVHRHLEDVAARPRGAALPLGHA